MLSEYYEKGIVVPRDLALAVKCCREAAERGYVSAQYGMGLNNQRGIGCDVDMEEAVRWYKLAAEANYDLAVCHDMYVIYRQMNNLGVCYFDGTGVKKDYKKALAWYMKSAERGNETAMNNVGVCHRGGFGVPMNKDVAYEWFKKSADSGYEEGMVNLGLCFEKGEGVPRDYKQAVKWYKKAAETEAMESGEALFRLARMYEQGLGVRANSNIASMYMAKAAAKQHPEAVYIISNGRVDVRTKK